MCTRRRKYPNLYLACTVLTSSMCVCTWGEQTDKRTDRQLPVQTSPFPSLLLHAAMWISQLNSTAAKCFIQDVEIMPFDRTGSDHTACFYYGQGPSSVVAWTVLTKYHLNKSKESQQKSSLQVILQFPNENPCHIGNLSLVMTWRHKEPRCHK